MAMQGDELRALRKRTGMTLAAFGRAIGVTGNYVGMMERGEKPINDRVATAARHAANAVASSGVTSPDQAGPSANPSETMIERVAEILYARCERISRERLRVTARVIIEAMREPTEAMKAVGAETGDWNESLRHDQSAWRDEAAGIWQNMIDAALAEEG